MKTYWRSGGKAPRNRWRWVVSFTPRQLYHQGKSHRYPLDSRLVWAPEPVWTRCRRERFPAPLRESNPDHPIVQPVASRYIDWAVSTLHVYDAESKLKNYYFCLLVLTFEADFLNICYKIFGWSLLLHCHGKIRIKWFVDWSRNNKINLKPPLTKPVQRIELFSKHPIFGMQVDLWYVCCEVGRYSKNPPPMNKRIPDRDGSPLRYIPSGRWKGGGRKYLH